MHSTLLLSLTAVSTLIVGCGPKISEFTATPRRVCAGDTVRLAFKTRGNPHLLAVRHGTDVADTTSYVLVAEGRGKQAYSPIDVVTFSPSARPVLAFDTDILGGDSLVGRDTLGADTWPDALQLDDVSADSGRAIVVRHGGTEGVVDPEEGGNPAWQGQTVSGAWEVRAALAPGEVAGDPAHAPPRHLYLRLGLVCGGGEP